MNIFRTSDLPEANSIESLDLVAISKSIDVSTYESQKVTWANVLGNITDDIIQTSGDISTSGSVTTTGVIIGSHVGYTHGNPLKLLDSVTGLSITVYLRGGILTLD